MPLSDITRDAILQAITEYDRLGQDEFLRRYGFERARSYKLIHNGKPYDSKAIVGVAHGYLPSKRALAASEFSGGEATVGRLLQRLGFTLETGTAAAWGAGTLAKLARLRQNSSSGSPAPHKPLLFLLALGRLQQNGSSELPWSVAAEDLADLITRFTPPARTSPRQRAAYPYTRLRADGVWLLDRDVSMDSVGELNAAPVTGRFEPSLEAALREDPALTREVARRLATENFEEADTAREVLQAVGLDPDEILARQPRRRNELADYLNVTEGDARQQFQELARRASAVDGERQPAFLPVETLLCFGASLLVNHRKFGGSTARRAPEPVPSLSRLFRRSPSSVLAKMANLDGSRPDGAMWDTEVGAFFREQPTRFEGVYRVLLHAARAEGVDPDHLSDFLELEIDPQVDILADSLPVPGSQTTHITASRDVMFAGRDMHIHLHHDGIGDLRLEDLAVYERSVELNDKDPRTVDDYVLMRKLGRGAMGVVYLAHDTDGRLVALKLVRPEFAEDERFLRRFVQEVELASTVDPAYTAQVLHFGTRAGRQPYLVTEFIDGPNLDEQVTNRGPLSPGSAKAIAIGTAAALIAIHNAGIVHRDLKPSNVILSRFNPRVIDFGIARSLNAATRLTQAGGLLGSPVGSPAYMSPEQLKDEEATQASDVFSWAGLMVYVSTGRQPFGTAETSMFALPYLVRETEPDLSKVPTNIRALVAAALHKDPRSRPTAPEIVSTLLAGN